MQAKRAVRLSRLPEQGMDGEYKEIAVTAMVAVEKENESNKDF
ncbi:hypothetical protein [Hahella chejuensis]|nr:hypothetical protein [Hahella chejuensis]